MVKLYLVFVLSYILCLTCPLSASIVLTFEDLGYDQSISGMTYQDIFWEYSSQPGVFFKQGSWVNRYYDPSVDDPSNDLFGTHNLANSYGCIEISFEFLESYFPDGVFAFGAYFNGMGNENNWPVEITATGLMNDREVWSVSLYGFTNTPEWLSMNDAIAVDKITFVVTPKNDYDPEYNEYGYFGMDNLTFEKVIVPEPMSLILLALGAAAFRHRK